MVQKRETKAINKLCVREILSLSFVCGACFFEFRCRNLVCFGIAYKFHPCALPFSRVPVLPMNSNTLTMRKQPRENVPVDRFCKTFFCSQLIMSYSYQKRSAEMGVTNFVSEIKE